MMKRRGFLGAGLVGLGTSTVSTSGYSFQFFPRPSDEKWAVLFGTWYGTARDASIWISEGMGGIAHVFDARQNPDLKAYDHLVIGTAIQGGKGTKDLESVVQANGAEVAKKVRGLFVVCGAMGETPGLEQKTEYIDDYLAKLCGVPTPSCRAFVGEGFQKFGILSCSNQETFRRL